MRKRPVFASTTLTCIASLGLSTAVPVLAQPQRPDRSTSPTVCHCELWVELVDSTSLAEPEAVTTRLRSEVEAIYARAGVRIRWISASPIERRSYAVSVYLLDAMPRRLVRHIDSFGRGQPLGLAFGRVGPVSGPTVYVSQRAVTKAAAGSADARLLPEAMGVALGRVVAHEMAHRFLQRGHTRRGVLREDFGADELAGSSSELFFTAEQVAQLWDVSLPASRADDDGPLESRDEESL